VAIAPERSVVFRPLITQGLALSWNKNIKAPEGKITIPGALFWGFEWKRFHKHPLPKCLEYLGV